MFSLAFSAVLATSSKLAPSSARAEAALMTKRSPAMPRRSCGSLEVLKRLFLRSLAAVLIGERIVEASMYFLLAMESHLWSKAFEYNH